MDELLAKLKGVDRRTIGRVPEVVAEVLRKPDLFEPLVAAMANCDPLVRMRAADAVEKIIALHPRYLQPYKQQLLQDIAYIDQQEVRWHVAQMLPRLELTAAEKATAADILIMYLGDKSKIVKVFALQALAQFAERDQQLQAKVIPLLQDAVANGSPALRSRARQLLAGLVHSHQAD